MSFIIDPNTGFATRVALCLACLVIATLAGLELRDKFHAGKIGNPGFWIALPLFQVSFGAFCAFTWGAVYTWGRVKGYEWSWMLDSWFIAVYTSIIFTGAIGMVYGITRSIHNAIIVTLGIIVVWLTAYVSII